MKKEYLECPKCGSADVKVISSKKTECNRCSFRDLKARFKDHRTALYGEEKRHGSKSLHEERIGSFGHTAMDDDYHAARAGGRKARWKG